jgi:hypothetical protein
MDISERIRALSYLLIGLDLSVGGSPDFDVWYRIGQMFDELGNEVLEIAQDLENSK